MARENSSEDEFETAWSCEALLIRSDHKTCWSDKPHISMPQHHAEIGIDSARSIT